MEAGDFRQGDDLVRVTAVPGHHSRSAVVQAILPTVVGWILELEHHGRQAAHRLYVTGDTLMTEDLARIRDRFPSIDTMVISTLSPTIAPSWKASGSAMS